MEGKNWLERSDKNRVARAREGTWKRGNREGTGERDSSGLVGESDGRKGTPFKMNRGRAEKEVTGIVVLTQAALSGGRGCLWGLKNGRAKEKNDVGIGSRLRIWARRGTWNWENLKKRVER